MLTQEILDIEPNHFWQVHPHEKRLLQKKRGLSRLAYLLLFKWFENTASFPKDIKMLPLDLIEHGIVLSEEIIAHEELFIFFRQGRIINRYKQEIRAYFEFKNFDKDCPLLHEFLIANIFKEKNDEALRFKLCTYLKGMKVEIPFEAILLDVIKNAKTDKEQRVFSQIESLLSDKDKNYIDDYLLTSDDFDGVCQFLRQDSSDSSKEGVANEIKRLEILKQLPVSSFGFISDINIKQRNVYRRRFYTDTPERTKRRTDMSRYSLAIIFCFQRHQEAVDNLIEHLLYFIHQIKKTADKKQEQLNKEIGKRLGDLDSLYSLAEINRDFPQGIIEQVVYPSVSQETIDHIIKTRDFARQIKKKVRESVIKRYSNSYRHSIFSIIDCLKFHSNNTAFLEALTLIKRYQKSKLKYYPIEEEVPIYGLISKQQQKEINDRDDLNNSRVLRKNYECAIFKLLRLKLKHKEVWVSGAFKYRDPVDDLPKDFDEKLEEYFSLMDTPLLAKDFTNKIKEEMSQNIRQLDNGFPKNELVNIVKKKGKPWIELSPLVKIEEPKFIQRLKEAVLAKWGVIDLLDILKEVDLRENFTNCFSTAGNREILDRETIRKRLLLCNFAIGTNAGLKRTAGASKGAVTFEEMRHIKNFFLNKDDLREAINTVVNSIFRIRNPKIWRSVSTACAADSKQFGCFTKNLLTEWSPRHHSSGVMIYWHVSDQYICVYSQMKTCTSSEVASMLQGIMDQETQMEIESQYVDSHGQSELGFALSYLEQFDLLPRYKTIGNQKLYLPTDDFQIKNIKEITTRTINWDLIEEQYNEMIKHGVALKLGTATAETIIRKFARSNYQHPTFKAFMELGKAVKTIFLCRYLHSVELRQQINAGLNVVENWNGANDFVYYGKSGEIVSNSRDDQEISMLCLHLLQTSISYINTLLIEELLLDEYWINLLGEDDYRALTALFYLHINPYGSFEVDLTKRLIIKLVSAGAMV
ncbi:MAG: Tn3 family transposase [Tatlockia sp.]|nr:Tn3 family transposase [Tatlockia sp.]